MDKSENITTLAKSLSALQSELKPVPKDAINPFYKSRYADLSAIWESSRALLCKHGFAISQLPQAKEGQIVLTTLLLHISGEWLSSDLLVTPSKQGDPQSVGSALTYARRYALSAILGICSEEDDDAEDAMGRTRKAAQPARTDSIGIESKQKPATKTKQFNTAGEFLAACMDPPIKMNRTQVLEALGTPSLDGVNFDDAYVFLAEAGSPL